VIGPVPLSTRAGKKETGMQKGKRHMVKAIAAVDIGGTKIAVGAVSETGTVLNRMECATAPKDGFASAVGRIQEMLHVAGIGLEFEGVGIACPGPLDPFTGILGEIGTLPGWQGANLLAGLGNEFGTRIAVENDADAAAIAEMNAIPSGTNGCFLYVTVSTGIGGGILFSGRLYRGAGGSHPEIGHQIIDASGPQCYCGVHGCWESLASGAAMSEWIGVQRPSLSEITAEGICALARNRDSLAERAVEREGYYLGLGLANLVTLFSPTNIILGGGLMRSSTLFLDHALQVVREKCTQVPAEKTRIASAALGADAGLVGAAQAWFLKYR